MSDEAVTQATDEATGEASRDEHQPETNQPGLAAVREAVANRLATGLPFTSGEVRRDVLAGLNGALASVPDGMATALLVGVNPVFGLFACMAGPIAGGLLSSTALMVVATTSSSALAAGQALAHVPADDRAGALWLLLLLVAAIQIAFGVARLGKLTRFVSFSVTTGFIAGVAVLTILSQLPTLTGYRPGEGDTVQQTADLVMHLGSIDATTSAVGVGTLIATFPLLRTPWRRAATLAAVVVPSLIVALLPPGSVQLVSDVGTMPQGLPLPSLPSFAGISQDLFSGAFAVAAITLIQAAGLSQSLPNPDGSRRSVSRDFIAQGAGNIACALFSGTPVGGSLRTTAVTLIAGAQSRLAPIMVGVWMAAIVILLPALVARVAMPTLAAVLIVAGASTIRPSEAVSVLSTGWPSRIALATTFLATLLLSIPVAVALGVALSAILYLYKSAGDVSVLEVVRRGDGRYVERRLPQHLASSRVTIIDVYGPLFFASARRFEQLLPDTEGSEHPAVVLRLRGRTSVGATLIDVLDGYASNLAKAGGKLFVSGLNDQIRTQLIQTNRLPVGESVELFASTEVIGESTGRAVDAAREWLASLDGRELRR